MPYDKKGGDFDTSVPDVKEKMFQELSFFMCWHGYGPENIRKVTTYYDFDGNEFVIRVKLLPPIIKHACSLCWGDY
jgi:hypothetical protein